MFLANLTYFHSFSADVVVRLLLDDTRALEETPEELFGDAEKCLKKVLIEFRTELCVRRSRLVGRPPRAVAFPGQNVLGNRDLLLVWSDEEKNANSQAYRLIADHLNNRTSDLVSEPN